jgi:hypothetical protein
MWSNQERETLKTLDTIMREQRIRGEIDAITAKLVSKLNQTPGQQLAKEPVRLDLFGEKLPGDSRACWVYLTRAPSATGEERHPNSHQRTISYQGKGDLQLRQVPVLGDLSEWKRNVLLSDLFSRLEFRWISIPPNNWHKAVASEGDWVMVSFHTAPENELIEEHPA